MRGAATNGGREVAGNTVRNARLSLAMVFFTGGAVMASWASRIPAVASDLGLSPGALGFALFCMAVGAPVAMLLCGTLTVRYGSRLVLRVALAVNCAALVLPALSSSVWTLAASLALLGGSGGALVVAQNAQGVEIEEITGRPLLNSMHASLSLGWLGGSLAGAGAASAGISPIGHFSIVGAVLLCAGLLAARYLVADGKKRGATERAFPKLTKELMLFSGIAFCCLFAEGSVLDWSAVYLRESLGAGEGLAALGPAAFAATMTVGRLVGNRLTVLVSRSSLVRGAGSIATVGVLTAAGFGEPWAGLLGFGLLGAGLSVIFPALLGAVGGDGSGSPGPGIATVSAAGYLGLLGGPAVIGAVVGGLDLRLAFVPVAVLVGTIPLVAGCLDRSLPYREDRRKQ